MRIKLSWSVNSLAISESSLRQEFRSILSLSKIKSICRMSDFKTQEVAEMSKIFYLKLLTEKILDFLNPIRSSPVMIISSTYRRSKIVHLSVRQRNKTES